MLAGGEEGVGDCGLLEDAATDEFEGFEDGAFFEDRLRVRRHGS